MHILSKIANNKEAGTVKELKRDEKDLAKYQVIVEQHNSKRLGEEQKSKPIAFKCNKSQKQKHKRCRVSKGSEATQPLQKGRAGRHELRNPRAMWAGNTYV